MSSLRSLELPCPTEKLHCKVVALCTTQGVPESLSCSGTFPRSHGRKVQSWQAYCLWVQSHVYIKNVLSTEATLKRSQGTWYGSKLLTLLTCYTLMIGEGRLGDGQRGTLASINTEQRSRPQLQRFRLSATSYIMYPLDPDI